MRRLKNGEIGERMAEQWFANNGWHMVRTQPVATILGIVTLRMFGMLQRYIPRLAFFGHIVIARMGRGGAPDYTGYHMVDGLHWQYPEYRACEVKEAAGDTMPASRLEKDQRDFLKALPPGCAWVGIFWTDTQKFRMHPFIEKGSYSKEGGI